MKANTYLTIRVPPEIKESIERIAAKEERTVSSVGLRLIKKALGGKP